MTVDVLPMLSILKDAPRDITQYCQRLAKSPDRYLRAGALASLLDLDTLPRPQWKDAIEASSSGWIAARAFTFFEHRHEYDLAQQVIAAYESAEQPNIANLMRASLHLDDAQLAEQHGALYLSDGQMGHLFSAGRYAETASGWRASIIWAARAAVLYPVIPTAALPLLTLVEQANQLELMRAILDIFSTGDVFPAVRKVFRASLSVAKKNPSNAVALLGGVKLQEIPDEALRRKVCQVLAAAYEALGDFRNAANWYVRLNEPTKAKAVDKTAFIRGVNRLSQARWGPLPPDQNESFLMMVGFPRSGTTLLENALAAHPDIETFEEIPSFSSAHHALDEILDEGIPDGPVRQGAVEAARERYYLEIKRRTKKDAAHVYVDKLPIRSAYIKVMEQIFPTKKYIFSLRHPYDVVLSCFKQSFNPNPAMENFRSISDAAALYDRVMSVWFEVFPGESERVHYVRYDDLVTSFDRVMSGVLAFCGVPWSDSVHDFHRTADGREGATPSYAKVRSGLTLGVQSSWRNFRFLFEPRDAKLLDPWVERFGYDAAEEKGATPSVKPESRAGSGSVRS